MVTSLGWYGYDYRSSIGLHRTGGVGAVDPSGPLWDCFIGPLPFLLASNPSDPFVRETAPVSKQRMDTARDPGEVSLDSGIWLRGQTSWHLGAGQDYAEPLEGDPDEARFRFATCGGVDPWTPGQVGMLKGTLLRGTGARKCLGTPAGVVVPGTGGVMLYPSSGSATTLSTKTTVTGPITASDTHWFGASSSGIQYGLLATGGEGQVALANISALTWAKDRLWAAAGKSLYEITSLSPPTLPGSPTFTFRGGSVVAVASGAAALYVMVVGAFTSIYAIVAADDGSLSQPREVLTLPRGEQGLAMYGYLGRYLAVGTSKGVRIADCSEAALPLGPVIVPMTGGCLDMVGDGPFLYVTGGTERISPDSLVWRPGLYRIDMSHPIGQQNAYGDSAASRFPFAPDLYQPGSGTLAGRAWSVTVFEDEVWFVAGSDGASASLYRGNSDTRSTVGWLDSGAITFSTSERKGWLSFGLEVTGSGTVYMEGDVGNGFAPVSSTVLRAPRNEPALSVDPISLPPSSSMRHRVYLTGDGTAQGSPVLQTLGLRATPVPRRSRYIQVPLMCFDFMRDRNGTQVGYDGYAADRLADLEGLEEQGHLIAFLDKRTGEETRCTIEKVSFTSTTPPDKRFSGFGGVVLLTLLSA